MNVFDYEVEHHGVKGMKWGVRRALGSTGHIIGSSYAKGAKYAKKQTKDFATGMVKGTVKIAKDEYRRRKLEGERGERLEKKLSNPRKIRKMSEEDIKKYTTRLQLENNLKRLSEATNDKNAKKAYKNRTKLTGEKIREINTRLQMEENLKQQISQAKKNNQNALGKNVTNIMMNTSVDLLKTKLDKSNGPTKLSTEVVFTALKQNARSETKQMVNDRNSNKPSYRNNFEQVMTDQMWNSIDKRTPGTSAKQKKKK